MTSLEMQINDISGSLVAERTNLGIMKVEAFDPRAMARIIRDVDPDSVDGIAIFGPETPSVRDAIDQIRQKGVLVVALVLRHGEAQCHYFFRNHDRHHCHYQPYRSRVLLFRFQI